MSQELKICKEASRKQGEICNPVTGRWNSDTLKNREKINNALSDAGYNHMFSGTDLMTSIKVSDITKKTATKPKIKTPEKEKEKKPEKERSRSKSPKLHKSPRKSSPRKSSPRKSSPIRSRSPIKQKSPIRSRSPIKEVKKVKK